MQVSADQVVEAIVQGRVLTFANGELRLEEIPEDEHYSGAFLEYGDAVSGAPKADLAAEDLRAALTRFNAEDSASQRPVFDPRGLRLKHIRVVGTLDLNYLSLPFALGFSGCTFSEWIWIDHFHARQLMFDGCTLSSIGGDHVVVDGELKFFQCESVVQVFLPDAKVGKFALRDDSFLGQPSQIRTVLNGAHFNELIFMSERIGDILPAGEAVAMSVSRLHVASDEPVPLLAGWLRGDETPRTWRDRRAQAAASGTSNRTHYPQAWSTLADALANAGLEGEARSLMIESERHRAEQRGPLRHLLSTVFLDATIRYGYGKLRAIWLLLAAYALAVLLVGLNRDSFVSTQVVGGEAAPGFWPVLYALDIVISPFGTGQADTWWVGASQGLAIALTAIKFYCWIIFGLVLTGLAGVFNKKY